MMNDPLDKIRIVLVGTTHPGNIGATARAMKTMGLARLDLVAPQRFPAAEATAMASGADDLLMSARIHGSLREALVGVGLVVGTTARMRSLEWPVASPREAVPAMLESARDADVAIVFGREHSGLTNLEIELCHRLIRIPASAAYSSLNLAGAVQIVAYELRVAALAVVGDPEPIAPRDAPPASVAELDHFYNHLTAVMLAVDFMHPDKPRRLLRRLRRLFNRAEPDHNEVQILRGFLSAIDARIGREQD